MICIKVDRIYNIKTLVLQPKNIGSFTTIYYLYTGQNLLRISVICKNFLYNGKSKNTLSEGCYHPAYINLNKYKNVVDNNYYKGIILFKN